MDYDFYWEKFKRTGNISDYLSYLACTSEDDFIYEPDTENYKNKVHEEKSLLDADFS